MKAANHNRVVLVGFDGTPWGVALGHGAMDEHRGGCFGLRDWLGIPDDAVTVEDACCRPMASASDWALVQHADAGLATLLVLNDPLAEHLRAKGRGVRRSHVRDARSFHGACQKDDALVTAYDRRGAVLAAFRPADRRLLTDLADALGRGRLAVADGRVTGPILVLADRVPANAFLEAIGYAACALANDEDGTGIDYALHPTRLLETCVAPGPAR